MGNMAYRALALSQADVEELCEVHCAGRFRQSEVEALFKRFRDLDRDHKVWYCMTEEQNQSLVQRTRHRGKELAIFN